MVGTERFVDWVESNQGREDSMSEQFKHDAPMASPQGDSKVVELITKLQQQLVFLEKKIDGLISQLQERPFKSNSFSKPYRSFDRSKPYHSREQYSNAGERRDYHPGRRFGKHQNDESSGFTGKRDHHPGRQFGKHQSDESSGFARKKKPFFPRRKERR